MRLITCCDSNKNFGGCNRFMPMWQNFGNCCSSYPPAPISDDFSCWQPLNMDDNFSIPEPPDFVKNYLRQNSASSDQSLFTKEDLKGYNPKMGEYIMGDRVLFDEIMYRSQNKVFAYSISANADNAYMEICKIIQAGLIASQSRKSANSLPDIMKSLSQQLNTFRTSILDLYNYNQVNLTDAQKAELTERFNNLANKRPNDLKTYLETANEYYDLKTKIQEYSKFANIPQNTVR